MKASLRWIREFIDLPADDPVPFGAVLSNLGIDVARIEAIEARFPDAAVSTFLDVT